jgi:protocatechuate 4,5-dioxygenase beta chain
MFGEHGPDPEWDRRAIQWLADGDIDAILDNVTFESLMRAGNATPGFLDIILMLGIAGPIKASYVDELDLFHTREMYVTWYPAGDPREEAAR